MHYTLGFTEGNEKTSIKPQEKYETIKDCINWASNNNIDYYLLRITEWEDEFDAYGIPEISTSVNLQAVVDDNEFESLSKYINY